jgi:hypothetical protein
VIEGRLRDNPAAVAADSLFAFVQLEFGFLLGPSDGRFIVRSAPNAEPDRVLVLGTLGARERRGLLRGRRGQAVEESGPEPVPTARATAIHPEPFPSAEEAGSWLSSLRSDGSAAGAELAAALAYLNAALHAHRAAAADPHARDVSARQALVARIGYGSGDQVAEGRYAEAWELPGERARAKRSMESPDERFAAILGGREPALACEELVLRARTDIDAGRRREAALQARVALEALLAECGAEQPAEARSQLESDRYDIGEAANAAVRGDLPADLWDAVTAAVERMESALRRRRLSAR